MQHPGAELAGVSNFPSHAFYLGLGRLFRTAADLPLLPLCRRRNRRSEGAAAWLLLASQVCAACLRLQSFPSHGVDCALGGERMAHPGASRSPLATAQAFGGPAYSALVPSLVEKEDSTERHRAEFHSIQPGTSDGSALGGFGPREPRGDVVLWIKRSLISSRCGHVVDDQKIDFQSRCQPGRSMLSSIHEGFGFIRQKEAYA